MEIGGDDVIHNHPEFAEVLYQSPGLNNVQTNIKNINMISGVLLLSTLSSDRHARHSRTHLLPISCRYKQSVMTSAQSNTPVVTLSSQLHHLCDKAAPEFAPSHRTAVVPFSRSAASVRSLSTLCGLGSRL